MVNMSTEQKKPMIFSFSNYREYLEAVYHWKGKQQKGRFSYRAFASLIGFASPNYMQLIIKGKKNLSSDAVHKIAKALKLNRKEYDFLEALVDFNQAKTSETKERYLEKMLSFKDFLTAQKITKDQYAYFSKWYFVAIRELIGLEGFKPDPVWVGKQLRPQISSSQAEDALKLLKRLGMIQKNDDGKWVVSEAHLTTEREVVSTYVKQFHKQMIKRAFDSIEQSGKTREVSSLTMSINKAQFKEVRKRIADFEEEIQNFLSEKDEPADRVCQLNYQFFHLTEPEENE